MRQIIVDLNISADEYLKHYQRVASMVETVSRDGLRVQFPTGILQRFVTREGVHGTFVIYFDDNNKFQRIERLEP
ncbi:hypothetical protein BTA51_21435 [Hahella sp. CCB-MM4]|uniref:DUF2835 domain-containing protein n=1 Tax=Hahella sp. (strain CCB-MM4) TaxID=1926491 RepID=UPI000B9C4E0A|nr:DUF2835 domain-containing protein [Hahella sp. CCB-MM4]OZG71215.1 hypothetical protein BTA51_21435 [Hahella sp. CCB-MM4]